MTNKINLYWFKYKKNNGNFGDELNPYIFSKLTSTPVRYINLDLLWNNKHIAIRRLTRYVLKGKIDLITYSKYFYWNLIKRPQICLGVGSILQSCHYNNTIIWGSGIISADSNVPNGEYRAVRGYKTIDKIKELGFSPPKLVGDPALLLPKLYTPKTHKSYSIGIIPHYTHFDEVKKNFPDASIRIINMLDPIETVITEINKCSLTISTSLHGIIVSHAYGVQSIRASMESCPLYGDDIKFEDYFSSVNITPYKPIDIVEYYKKEGAFIIRKINDRLKAEVLLPNPSLIKKIQQGLIDSFPFPKRKLYKNRS